MNGTNSSSENVNINLAAYLLGVHTETLRRNIIRKEKSLTIETLREYAQNRLVSAEGELKEAQNAIKRVDAYKEIEADLN